MIYILLGYIALSWIASFIAILIPRRYEKVLFSLLVIVNPFFIIALIDIVIAGKRKRKLLGEESKEEDL